MPQTAITTWTGQKLEPFYRPDEAVLQHVKLPASVNYAQGTILGELTGTNEKQKLVITGGPTGGTFTMTFGGQTTAAIPYNSPNVDIRDALENLSTILDGSVQLTGGPLPAAPIYIVFQGTLGGTNVAQLTTTDSLTGGTSPSTAVTTVTGGAAGTMGTFKAYDNDNTDGSGIAKAILPFACQTDASGNVTFSGTSGQAGNEVGVTMPSVPVYIRGYFATADLVGLDTRAADALGRIVNGDINSGVLAVGV